MLLPVTTPFDDGTGDADRRACQANLRRWLDRSADGFVVAGSTGEAPLLDEIEILRLVEWARAVTPRGVPVIAGTGLESTRGTVRLCREVARNGADAVLVRPPSYYAEAMTSRALTHHYRAVADGSPVPLVLYHIPRYVPVGLDPELVAGLVRHDNVAGIKDSSGDIRNLGELAEACSGEASVLVGAGTLLYGGLEVGASGGILAVGLLATEACSDILAAWRDGDTERAGSLQERVGGLHRAVVGKLGVAGVKAALDRLGMEGGAVRSPLQDLEEEGRRRAARALESAGLSRRAAPAGEANG